MSVGRKVDRMKDAARAQRTPQELEVFLAQFTRQKSEDRRRYRIRHPDGDYFKKWEGTPWETVKRFAIWTKDATEAMTQTLAEWEKGAMMDLVCGFGGVRLEQV
jgi:hypothetical protein